MKKIKLLLHEVTIINFSLFLTLVKRYYLVSLTIFLFFVCGGLYKYNQQNLVYSYSVGFKNFAEASNSPSKAIMEMLGEKTRELTEFEVEGLLKSVSTRRELAKRIIKREDFESLNFNSITTKNVKSHSEIFASCNNNEECLVKRLQGLLSRMIFISLDGKVDDQFELTSQSLDEKTAKALLEETSASIQIERVGTLKHYIGQQIDITKKLRDDRRQEISSSDILTVKANLSKMKDKLESINSKLDEFQKNLILEQGLLNKAQSILEENNKIGSRGLNYRNVAESQKAKNLIDYIASLEENIEIIALNKDSTDNNILSELKKELSVKRVELKKIGRFDTALSSKSFRKKQREDNTESSFEYNVLKKRYARSKKEHARLLEEKGRLVSRKANFEKTLEVHAPALEYFKILDKKIAQLRLTESTIISDLVFEKYNSGLRRMKKLSVFRTIVVSFMLSLIVLFLALIIRYVLDDRIYDERELSYNSESLKVIGKTPEFI